MNSSMYNSIAGIKSYQYGMDVIADNISNVNTVGFKSSTTEFSDYFSSSLSQGTNSPTSDQVGLGSSVTTTALNISQGTLMSSDATFDMALSGEGWFGVIGNDGETYYTRSGDFSVDSNGDLVNTSGYYLSGTLGGNISLYGDTTQYVGTDSQSLQDLYAVSQIEDIDLTTPEAQTKINLPEFLYFPPEATTYVDFSANLNPEVIIDNVNISMNDDAITSSIISTDETINISGDLGTTSGILDAIEGDSVIITITNGEGKSINKTVYLDSNLEWNLDDFDVSSLTHEADVDFDITEYTIDSLIADATVTATLVSEQEVANEEHFSTQIISPEGEKQTLEMTFIKEVPQTTTGTVWNAVVQVLDGVSSDANVLTTSTGSLSFDANGSLLTDTIADIDNSGTNIDLIFGDTEIAYDGMTSITGLDTNQSVDKDGYVDGDLSAYGMDSNGNVVAEFTNGRSVPIAKVAVYHFINDQGLSSLSGSIFSQSANSGDPIFYTDDTGKTFLGSSIENYNLEGSNVDLSVALTELIIMQKAFDASSKGITTSDEMIQNAINMKR